MHESMDRFRISSDWLWIGYCILHIAYWVSVGQSFVFMHACLMYMSAAIVTGMEYISDTVWLARLWFADD